MAEEASQLLFFVSLEASDQTLSLITSSSEDTAWHVK
jgi:hypothetical protein